MNEKIFKWFAGIVFTIASAILINIGTEIIQGQKEIKLDIAIIKERVNFWAEQTKSNSTEIKEIKNYLIQKSKR